MYLLGLTGILKTNKGGEFHYSHLTDEAQLPVKFTFTHPEVKETDPKAQALPTPHPI